MFTVLCVGIAVLDLVFQVDALPTAAGKHRAAQRLEVGGGVAANAAVTISRLGGRARFIGCLGKDETGDRIIAGLKREGVDTARVRRVPGQESPLSAVLVDGTGERLIVNHAGPDLFTAPPAVKPPELDGADAVLVDMRWPNGAEAALAGAAATGIPGILDCDHDPTGTEALLAAASHIVFALPTLRAYTGMKSPADALLAVGDVTDAWVAVTDGAAGVHWREGDDILHLPAFPIAAVDTLGAGDVFHGAFALAMAEQAGIEQALRLASAAAALKCMRFGGRAGIPTRTEVESFLKEQQ